MHKSAQISRKNDLIFEQLRRFFRHHGGPAGVPGVPRAARPPGHRRELRRRVPHGAARRPLRALPRLRGARGLPTRGPEIAEGQGLVLFLFVGRFSNSTIRLSPHGM